METPKKGIIQRLLNIYPGEEKNVLLFAFLGFIWAFASTCALKFADALFLLHVGAQSLPKVYMLIACGMFSIALLLLSAFHKFSSYQIYTTTLILGIGFYCCVFGLLFFKVGFHSHWLWYGLKMSGFFLFAVLLTCYWTFIDQYHHLQDSKRLYSLFSSTIFLGSASTGFVMNSGKLDLHHLVLLIIFLFVTAVTFIRYIQSKLSIVVHEDDEHEGQVYEEGGFFRFLLQTILNSRFTMLLMTCNILNYLLLVITEYNYMYTFQNHFASQVDSELGGGTEAQLTLFLGQWLSTVSVFNLLFGLFVYSRLIRRFGVNIMLVVTPLLLIMAFTGWSISPSLIFPLIGYFVVEGTLYVIDDSNFNLLLNAVPSKVKYKIRVAIESFFEPVGMLFSALLLTFFQDYSKLLGFILACCLLFVALGLRSNYLKAIFSNLSQNAIRFQRSIKEWLKKINDKQQKLSISKLLEILKVGDTQEKLFACECLFAFEDDSLLRQILNNSSMFYPSAKVKLIELLSQSPFSKHSHVLDTLQGWIQEDSDPKVKGAVHFYLAEQGLLHPDKAFNDLNSNDMKLRGAAILSYKKSYAFLNPSAIAYNQTMATQHLEQMLQSTDEEELSMALEILGIVGTAQEVELLISFITSPSLEVSQRAARSLALILPSIDPTQHAPTLIDILHQINDHETRLSCLRALKGMNDSSFVDDLINVSIHFRPNERRQVEEIIFEMGLRAVPSLLSITRNTKKPDLSRLLAGRILGRLALPQLHANLSEIIQVEIERAYYYFFHHQTIQSHYPDIDLKILEDVLFTGYQSVITFIIQLLGVAGEIEDVEILSQALRSTNPKVRSQVVETLEKTCEPTIFRLLQPLVDDIPYSEKLRAYMKLGNRGLSLTELLDRMSLSSAQVDQILAATMKFHLNLPNWRETLRQQMSQQDEIFHHFAYELLET